MLSGKIMIVEDQPNFRKGLAKMIEEGQFGWSVAGEAANGREALTMLDQVQPDLVLTDIRMPLMNGIDFVTELRQRYPEMPFIILTAYKSFDYAQSAVKLGALDYLVKPCTEQDVRQVLSKAARYFYEQFAGRRRKLPRERCDGHLTLRSAPPATFGSIQQERVLEFVALLVGAILHGRAGHVQGQLERLLEPVERMEPKERDIYALSLSLALQETIRQHFNAEDNGTPDAMPFCLPMNDRSAAETVRWLRAQADRFLLAYHNWKAMTKSGNLLENATAYIEAHYNEECRLTDVAAHIHLNPSYFSVWFKKATGESFTRYVTRLRMEKAALLLRNTDLKISEVAGAVGFNEPNYFTNAFKQFYCMSPKEYRNGAFT